MPLSITLRRSAESSPFREQLLRLIQSPRGDSVILCSGYVTEGAEPHHYSVLTDKLLDALKHGATAGVEVRGAMLEPNWSRDNFTRFVTRLRDEGLSVTAFISETKRWHAKIAIRLDGDKPLAAIIGSSNLTGAAYGAPPPLEWNFECDVTLWVNDPQLDAHFKPRPAAVEDLDFIAAILDPEVRQLDESTQLAALLREVRAAGGQSI